MAKIQLPKDLTKAEINTIRAALRYYQKEGMGDPSSRPTWLHFIAVGGDAEHEDISLDTDGIDDLCAKIGGVEQQFECNNCGAFFYEDDLDPIKDLLQRVDPGEPMPAGECPDCGCLCHLCESPNKKRK